MAWTLPGSRGELSAAGLLPDLRDPDWFHRMPTEGHWVYLLRAAIPGRDSELYGTENVYFGVTSHLRSRMRQHSRKWWWPVVDPLLSEFELYATRDQANRAEADLIRYYQPPINRSGKPVEAVR